MTRTTQAVFAGSTALCALVAHGAELELNVTGSQTLAQALGALSPSLSISDINGGSYAAYDIIKKGGGTLTFDTAIPNWTGNLGITNGVVVAIPVAKTVLGSVSSGAVYVPAGASIVIDDSDGASRDGNSLAPSRPIHIAGTGASGYYGAIKIINNNDKYRSCLPYNIIMDADATMCFGGNNINYVYDATGGSKTIDQQGQYVLTLTKAGSSVTPKFFWSGGVPKNPYRIVHDGVHFLNRGSSFPGGASNIVTLRNGAQLQFEDNVGQPWTLKLESNAYHQLRMGGDLEVTTAKRMWKGPVLLERSLDIAFDNAKTTTSVGFAGKVSGDYGFTGTANSGKNFWFFLTSGANDFTGGVALTNLTLGVGAGTAIPSGDGAAPLRLKNSNVVFMGNISSYTLPDVEFDGSGAITGMVRQSAFGTAKSLTKTGSGTLTAGTLHAVDEMTLKEGVVSLSSDARARRAGLHHGMYKVPDSHSSVWGNALDAADLQYTMSNTVVTTMSQFYHVSQYPAPDAAVSAWNAVLDTYWSSTMYHQYCTYDGYIWNNSPTTETWSVVCALNAYTYMTIGDTACNFWAVTDGRQHGGSSGTPPDNNAVGKLWNVRVQPGANKFRLRQYHRWNAPNCWYGNVCTNLSTSQPFTYWEDGNGLMVDKKGRGTTDMRNYERMEDPGDGSFFTYEKVDRDFEPTTIGLLRGQGGTLDLNGGEVNVVATEGAPNIVNGTMSMVAKSGTTLALGEGRFAFRFRKNAAGLYTGQINSETRSKPELTARTTYTNRVALALDYFYTSPKEWGNYPYITYDGYLWNTSGVDQVWSIMSVQNGKVVLNINGVEYSTESQWDGCWTKPELARKLWTNVPVRAGCNRFTVYNAAQYVVTGGYVGNISTNGIDWTADFGLAYDLQNRGSTDWRDYKRFVDPGDGTLFTTRADVDEPPTYDAVSGIAGSVLDIDGDDFTVPALAGVVKATNGTFMVTGTWSLTAAQAMSDAAVAENVTFADGVVFTMDAAEIAQLVKTKDGYAVARNWHGVRPVPSPALTAAGWSLASRDGELRLVRTSGICILFR